MYKKEKYGTKDTFMWLPLVQGFSVDDSELIETNCSLSARKDVIQLYRGP